MSEQIAEIARPIVEQAGAYLVDLNIRGEQGTRVIEVFVDTDTGITTGLCADISRDLSRGFDTADIIRGRYHLVVSSPGLDRPLKFPRQYRKNVGRKFMVTVRGGTPPEKIEGTLIAADEAGITLQASDKSSRHITFDDILDAHVRPAW